MQRWVSVFAALIVVLGADIAPAQSAAATKSWTSPDQEIRFSYPATWYLIDSFSAPQPPGVTVQNIAPVGRSPANGEFIVRFSRELAPPGITVAALRASDCSNQQFSRVLSCETVSINGWSWSWVNTLTVTGGEGEGDRNRVLATTAGGWIYRGLGIVPAGSLQVWGLAETKRILESVSIRGSKLSPTGVNTSALWFVALLLLSSGWALLRRSKSTDSASAEI